MSGRPERPVGRLALVGVGVVAAVLLSPGTARAAVPVPGAPGVPVAPVAPVVASPIDPCSGQTVVVVQLCRQAANGTTLPGGGVIGPVVGGLAGGLASGITEATMQAVLHAFAAWVAEGASSLLGQLGQLMVSTSSPVIGAGWFTTHYRVMAGLGAIAVLPLLLVSLMGAIVRQDWARLVRTVAVHLPLAMVATAAAIALVSTAMAITDSMSAAVAGNASQDIARALTGLGEGLVGLAGGGLGGFAIVLVSAAVAAGALLLWLELVVRSAAIYVAVLFLPLSLAGLVWPTTARWCRRLVETLAALVLSKFVIVAVLSLAAAALGAGTQTGVSGVIGGAAMLALAVVAPYALLRLIPVAEGAAAIHLEGLSRRAAQTGEATTMNAIDHVRRLMSPSPLTVGASGVGGAAPATATAVASSSAGGPSASPARGGGALGVRWAPTSQASGSTLSDSDGPARPDG